MDTNDTDKKDGKKGGSHRLSVKEALLKKYSSMEHNPGSIAAKLENLFSRSKPLQKCQSDLSSHCPDRLPKFNSNMSKD